jgi:CRP/FNR family transcriptional regulator, cyclic AMP receptor protein
MGPGSSAAPTATGFLAVLDESERSDLLDRAGRRRYRRGAVVFHEGGGSDEIVVVLSGRVKVSTVTADGKEVVLAFRGPGDLLGELSAIDGEARSATVGALEPVEAAAVSAREFRAFLSAHPRVAILLLEMLVRRLRDADRKRVEFGAHDTLGRVAARLVELAERYGEPEGRGLAITLPLNQEELAGWAAASRAATANALQTLRELGWIETGRRRIRVVDLDALRGRSIQN